MAKKPESRRQLRIRKHLEDTVGGRWYKIQGNEFQVSGIPDLIGCVQGLFFGFEVKEPGEVASEVQEYEIDQIRINGGTSCVVITPKEAEDVVRAVIAKSGKGMRLPPQAPRGHRRSRIVRTARNRKNNNKPRYPRKA